MSNFGPIGDAAASLLAAGDVAYRWDFESDRVTWWGELTGFLGDDNPALMAEGELWKGRLNPVDLPHRLAALSDHLATGDLLEVEYRLRRADGSFTWTHERARAELSASGSPIALLGVLRCVDNAKSREAVLEHQANFDALTGFYNRARLREILGRAIAYNQRYFFHGAYLAIGIDKLALINDGAGHGVADTIIVHVAQRIARAIRDTDVLGRVGGDTFGLVLEQCGPDDLAGVAEKILNLFRNHPIRTPQGPMHVTVSIGGLCFPDQVEDAGEAMMKAESALQLAKRQGRNCFTVYDTAPATQIENRRNLSMAEKVKDALRKDQMRLAFQPIVTAGDAEIEAHECLVRIFDDRAEPIPAYQFIPVVEEMGLSRQVDIRVLELTVEHLQRFPHLVLSMNISGFTCTDRSWLDHLICLVGDKPEVARRLIVEITETAAIRDLDETARFVRKVRELGARVALDDFGAGYTSYLNLKVLQVDIVKIDGSFVRDLSQHPDNRLFITTLVGLCSGFGLSTVAECVETEDDAVWLCEQGVQLLQGYHFGKPSLDVPGTVPALLQADNVMVLRRG